MLDHFVSSVTCIPGSYRPHPETQRKVILSTLMDSAQLQREVGELSLCLVMDVTGSMGAAIKEVREKIQRELLNELIFRWVGG